MIDLTKIFSNYSNDSAQVESWVQQVLTGMGTSSNFKQHAWLVPTSGTNILLSSNDFTIGNNTINYGVGEGEIPVGQFISRTATFEIINIDGRFDSFDFYGCAIYLFTTFEDMEQPIPLGEFIVTEPATYGEVIQLTAIDTAINYDNFIGADINLGDYLNTQNAYEIVKYVAGASNFDTTRDRECVLLKTYTFSGYTTTGTHSSELSILLKSSGRQIIGYIAQLIGANVFMRYEYKGTDIWDNFDPDLYIGYVSIISYDATSAVWEWLDDQCEYLTEHPDANIYTIDTPRIRKVYLFDDNNNIIDPLTLGRLRMDIGIYNTESGTGGDAIRTILSQGIAQLTKTDIDGNNYLELEENYLTRGLEPGDVIMYLWLSYTGRTGYLDVDVPTTRNLQPYFLDKWSTLTHSINYTTITGIKLISDTAQLISGADTGYVISISNNPLLPITDSDAQTKLDTIGAQIISAKFIQFNGNHIANPLIEFMDHVLIRDRRNVVYSSLLNNVSFTFFGHTEFNTSAGSNVQQSQSNSFAETAINYVKVTDFIPVDRISGILPVANGGTGANNLGSFFRFYAPSNGIDFNDIVKPSIYSISYAAAQESTNIPNVIAGYLVTLNDSSTFNIQFYVGRDTSNDLIYIRKRGSNAWDNWTLQRYGGIVPPFTAPSMYSGRATLQKGGYYQVGKRVYVEMTLKLDAARAANGQWTYGSGFPAPQNGYAPLAAYIASKQTYTASITTTGILSIANGATATAVDDVIYINGTYLTT